DAGVAGGGIENRAARFKGAASFALGDHPRRGTVLHRTTWVLPFGFGVDFHVASGEFREPIEAKKRRVADERQKRGSRRQVRRATHGDRWIHRAPPAITAG